MKVRPKNKIEEEDVKRARFANHCEICAILNRRYRFPRHTRAKDLTRYGYIPWVSQYYDYKRRKLIKTTVKHVIDKIRCGKRKGMILPLCMMTEKELESLKKFYMSI